MMPAYFSKLLHYLATQSVFPVELTINCGQRGFWCLFGYALSRLYSCRCITITTQPDDYAVDPRSFETILLYDFLLLALNVTGYLVWSGLGASDTVATERPSSLGTRRFAKLTHHEFFCCALVGSKPSMHGNL